MNKDQKWSQATVSVAQRKRYLNSYRKEIWTVSSLLFSSFLFSFLLWYTLILFSIFSSGFSQLSLLSCLIIIVCLSDVQSSPVPTKQGLSATIKAHCCSDITVRTVIQHLLPRSRTMSDDVHSAVQAIVSLHKQMHPKLHHKIRQVSWNIMYYCI